MEETISKWVWITLVSIVTLGIGVIYFVWRQTHKTLEFADGSKETFKKGK